MNKMKYEEMSSEEMSQIIGGIWIEKDGEWIWVDPFNLDEDNLKYHYL